MVEGEQDVWTMFFHPATEEAGFAACRLDFGEGRDGSFAAAVEAFADKESCGEASFDECVDDRVEDEAGFAVAEVPCLFVRLECEGVLIGAGKGELGLADTDTGDCCGDFVPELPHGGWEFVVVEESDNDGSTNAASAKDRCEALAGHLGRVEPELVEGIAEFEGASLDAAHIDRNGGVLGGCVRVFVGVKEREGGGELGRARATELGHELSYGGVALVAELRGGCFHECAGGGRDSGTVPEGEADGIF